MHIEGRASRKCKQKRFAIFFPCIQHLRRVEDADVGLYTYSRLEEQRIVISGG
jgi:hypothetical protein